LDKLEAPGHICCPIIGLPALCDWQYLGKGVLSKKGKEVLSEKDLSSPGRERKEIFIFIL